MRTQIDPSADQLWESVATIVTAQGTEDIAPRTDAEWQVLRRRAITLAEGANSLLISGQRVTSPGRRLEDAHVAGIFTAEQIEAAIAAKRPAFTAFAQALHAAGVDALAAIDAKDAARLLQVGGDLDAVCEGCHSTFWYPNSPAPGLAAAR